MCKNWVQTVFSVVTNCVQQALLYTAVGLVIITLWLNQVVCAPFVQAFYHHTSTAVLWVFNLLNKSYTRFPQHQLLLTTN